MKAFGALFVAALAITADAFVPLTRAMPRPRALGVREAENTVLVVGSVNADIVVSIPRLPVPGETLLGSGGQVLPGGKGANQAVAAGRLGAEVGTKVKFSGVFGSDVHAPMLRETMLKAGVDLSLSFTSPGPTGQAVILLQPGGENSIVLVPGANADWPAGWQVCVRAAKVHDPRVSTAKEHKDWLGDLKLAAERDQGTDRARWHQFCVARRRPRSSLVFPSTLPEHSPARCPLSTASVVRTRCCPRWRRPSAFSCSERFPTPSTWRWPSTPRRTESR